MTKFTVYTETRSGLVTHEIEAHNYTVEGDYVVFRGEAARAVPLLSVKSASVTHIETQAVQQ